MDMEKVILDFMRNHMVFSDSLLDDTRFSKHISADYVVLVWDYLVKNNVEKITSEKFEEYYNITFKDIADYWNKYILKE